MAVEVHDYGGSSFHLKRITEDTPMYTSDKRLYLTSDRSRVVEEHDPEAAFLLMGEGARIPNDEARKYGLLDAPEAESEAEPAPDEKPSLGEQAKAVPAPTEDKAQHGPKASK